MRNCALTICCYCSPRCTKSVLARLSWAMRHYNFAFTIWHKPLQNVSISLDNFSGSSKGIKCSDGPTTTMAAPSTFVNASFPVKILRGIYIACGNLEYSSAIPCAVHNALAYLFLSYYRLCCLCASNVVSCASLAAQVTQPVWMQPRLATSRFPIFKPFR